MNKNADERICLSRKSYNDVKEEAHATPQKRKEKLSAQ